MSETLPLPGPSSDADFELARRAVERGLLTRDQVESAIARRDETPSSRLLDLLPLSPEAIRSLQAGEKQRPLPPEVQAVAGEGARRVGKYVVVSHLGTGGMGMVVKAYDSELRRWAALKFLKAIGDEKARGYFEREARLAAGLSHPNIASIYEVGEHEGQPYIAIEYIDGQNLHQARRQMGLPQVVEAVGSVAEALRYAHSKGVIHRDLKPANVMVNREGRVFVTDFGLAKETALEGEGQSLGGSSVLVGTPQYMAPEQAKGKADVQSDVYGVGAILYELLTGRPPFTGETSTDVLIQVVNRDPVWPRKLAPNTPEDLEAIVLHALEKEKKRRYRDIEEMLADLDAYRQGSPLRHARRPTFVYVWGKRIRKQPFLWGTVAALILSLVGGMAFGAYTLVLRDRALADQLKAERNAKAEAQERQRVEREEREKTEVQRGRAEARLAEIYAVKGREAADRGDFGAAAVYFSESCRIRPSHGAGANARAYADLSPRTLWAIDTEKRVRSLAVSPDGTRILTGSSGGLVEEWDAATGKPTGFRVQHPSERVAQPPYWGDFSIVISVDYSPDGRYAASACDLTARLWDLRGAREDGAPVRHRDTVVTVQFSHDGEHLLTAGNDGKAVVWDRASRRAVSEMEGQLLHAATFSPDGEEVAIAGAFGICSWWNWREKRLLKSIRVKEASMGECLAYSPDGRHVAAGMDHEFILWELPEYARLGSSPRHHGSVNAVDYESSGAFRVTGGSDGVANVWFPRWGLDRAVPVRHASAVSAVRIDPLGEWIVSSDGRSVRAWTPGRAHPRPRLLSQTEPIDTLKVAPDWTRVVTTSMEGDLRFWDPQAGRFVGTFSKTKYRKGDLAAGGRRYVALTKEGSLRLFDATQGVLLGSEPLASSVSDYLTDDRHLWTGHQTGELRRWSLETGEKSAEVQGHQGRIVRLLPGPAGGIVSSGEDGWLRIWESADAIVKREEVELGEPVDRSEVWPESLTILALGKKGLLRVWTSPASAARDLGRIDVETGIDQIGFAASGRTVVLRTGNKVLRLWESKTGTELSAPRLQVASINLGPGTTLVAASSDERTGTIMIDARSGKTIERIGGPADILFGEFSPDGSKYIACESDLVVRLRDGATGQPLTPPMAHPSSLRRVALSPDLRTLATMTANQDVHLWDAATGERIGEPLPQRGNPRVFTGLLHFKPDGSALLTSTYDVSCRVWDLSFLAEVRAPEELSRQTELETGLKIGAKGEVEMSGAMPKGAVPRSARPADLARSESYLAAARSRADANAPGDALELFGAALEENPVHADALHERGNLHLQSGLAARAIQDFDRAIRIDPSRHYYYFLRALARKARGDVPGAIADLGSVLERNAQYFDAWLERARLRLDRGDIQPALLDLNRALALSPKSLNALMARADAHTKLGNFDGALADYKEAIRLKPQEYLAYGLRGRLLLDLKQPSEAIAHLQSAVQFCRNAEHRSILEAWLEEARRAGKP